MKENLLQRLDAIGESLKNSGRGLALLGLGSVGADLDRLDEFSDLDFFAIVEAGYKEDYLNNLNWLSDIHPVAYAFQNTADGYKLLYADGIFCEFAVFEPEDLQRIPVAAGRVVWQADGFDAQHIMPTPQQPPAPQSVEWLLGEALTNLYVGLSRYQRGEKLSAARFIQHYAVDRVLELARHVVEEQPGHPDAFSMERRYEQRFPAMAQHLPDFVQGYEKSVPSARAILDFLVRHFEVNTAMKQAILELCKG